MLANVQLLGRRIIAFSVRANRCYFAYLRASRFRRVNELTIIVIGRKLASLTFGIHREFGQALVTWRLI